VFEREALKLRPMTEHAWIENRMKNVFSETALISKIRERRETREEWPPMQTGQRFIAILASSSIFCLGWRSRVRTE
jgi:hypothetical protein